MDRKALVAYLDKYKIVPQKRFSQNFLVDAAIVAKMATHADLILSDRVLEIGPGLGAMTEVFCQHTAFVTAVEIDARLAVPLDVFLSTYDNYKLVINDFCKTLPVTLFPEGIMPTIIASNLPYAMMSAILQSVFSHYASGAKTMILLVEEVSLRRLFARVATDAYGPLAIFFSLYKDSHEHFLVHPHNFYPMPRTRSVAIICHRNQDTANCLNAEFVEFVRLAFATRRKTLINRLLDIPGYIVEKEDLQKLFLSLNLAANVRPQDVLPPSFIAIFAWMKRRIIA